MTPQRSEAPLNVPSTRTAVKFPRSARALRMDDYRKRGQDHEINPEHYAQAASQALDAIQSELRSLNFPPLMASEALPPRVEQLEAAMFQREGGHRGVWDPVGYGKTYELILASVPPFLYSTRVSLALQAWQWACDKFPERKFMLATGTNMDRVERNQRLMSAWWDGEHGEPSQPYSGYFINHEMMKYLTVCLEACSRSRQGLSCKHSKIKRVIKNTKIPMFEYALPITDLRNKPFVQPQAATLVGHVHDSELRVTQGPLKADFSVLPICNSLILDEAHWLRKQTASMSQGAYELSRLVPLANQGTGSPIFKDESDLWSQLHIMAPLVFPSYWKFVDTFLQTKDEGWKTVITGSRYANALGALLGRFGIKRPAKNLPPVVGYDPDYSTKTGRPGAGTSPIIVEMSKVEYNRYKTMREKFREGGTDEEGNKLDLFVAFNAATMVQKLQEYSFSKSKVDAVCQRVIDTCVRWPAWRPSISPPISSHTPSHKRKDIAMQYDIVVATLGSLGEGIEGLQEEVRSMIFAEEDYPFGRMEQAIGRGRRERHTQLPLGPIRKTIVYTYHIKNCEDMAEALQHAIDAQWGSKASQAEHLPSWDELVSELGSARAEQLRIANLQPFEEEPLVVDFVHTSDLDKAIHRSWTNHEHSATKILQAVMQTRD